MTIWLLALILTAIACASLLYAGAGRVVNAGLSPPDAARAHFRAQLAAIDTDVAMGRLGEAEATAARSELAREVMRAEPGANASPKDSVVPVWVATGLVAALAFGAYYFLGRPDLPAQSLVGRDIAAENSATLDEAIATIEARLKETPDDVRGWVAIAPIYMQLGRYDDAVHALRRVNELETPTAETLTDLGEALMMQKGGDAQGEPMDLFHRATALDPKHIRALYYIAGEETRLGNYEAAIADWNTLLALGTGSEPWEETARSGLAFAQAQLDQSSSAPASTPDNTQIEAMVEGLDARLKSEGGSIEDWTQLVRSRLVQGRTDDAQLAYEAARKAYPDAAQRQDLDVLAADNGLVAK